MLRIAFLPIASFHRNPCKSGAQGRYICIYAGDVIFTLSECALQQKQAKRCMCEYAAAQHENTKLARTKAFPEHQVRVFSGLRYPCKIIEYGRQVVSSQINLMSPGLLRVNHDKDSKYAVLLPCSDTEPSTLCLLQASHDATT